MVDFHLSVWRRERGRENYHVGMRNLIFLFSHRKIFLSVSSREKVELNSTFFSRTLTGKSNDSQSNRLIIENAAFLLFLSSQSDISFFALLFSRSG